MPDFTGTDGNDIFTGGPDADTAYGNGGNDSLSGGAGNDLLVGGTGSDTLNGGEGNDTLYSYIIDLNFPHPGYLSSGISYDVAAEADILNGGDGDDYIFAGYGDSVDGGGAGSFGNRLYISFMGATTGVSADFRLLQTNGSIVIGGATITNIQNMGYLEGSNYDDFLVPIDTYYPSGHNVYGRGGNDHIIADYYSGWGGGGLYGNEGNDILDGRPAQYGPALYGGTGDDTLYTSTNGFSAAYGGDGNDLIYSHGETWGGAGDDTIVLSFTYYAGPVRGEDGNDTITAAAQGNLISGGAGADVINGDAGNDQLGSADFGTYPTLADDMGLEQDVIAGLGGNDVIAAGFGDSVDGGSGSDTLSFSLGGLASGITFSTAGIVTAQPTVIGGGTIQNIETLVYLRGTEFDDNITAATQASLLTINAGAGNDIITSQNSSVDARGGSGNDRLISGAAGDVFDGGSGVDTIDYQNATAAVIVNLATGSGAGGDQLLNVENAVGGAFNDSLTGNATSNLLEGGSGNDTLDGGLGADWMVGGAGDDLYTVDNAGDVLVEAELGGSDSAIASVSYVLGAGVYLETLQAAAAGAISLTGNALDQNLYGNSAANVLEGGAGADTIDGGDGLDTASYAGASSAVTVNLALSGAQDTGGAGNDTLLNVENLLGSAFSDTLTGNVASNLLSGGAGDDLIDGGAGDDSINGGAGADRLYGGDGTDTLRGGADGDEYFIDGSDIVIEDDAQGIDYVMVSATYTLTANVENLILGGSANINGTGNNLGNQIAGTNGNNVLSGLGGNDIISGNGGDDTIFGGDGDDTLSPGAGADTVDGGAGNDTIIANTGVDTLTGGAGDDTFQDLAGNLSGDIITDFSVGDRILLGDANLASFTFSLSGNTLSYSGGQLTLQGGVTGTLVASAAAEGGVQITIEPAANDVAYDFNGDGRSDILWRSDTGQLSDWLANANGNGGFTANDANALTNAPFTWHVVGTGDFNGDGKDDLLWRNNNGQLSDWLANASGNGGFTANDANAFTTVSTSWAVVGVGDFNGDGKDDILWRNGTTGQMSDWLANANGNGGFTPNDANALTTVATSWVITGVGDFNGDGKDDLLWRNTATGQLSNWLANASGNGGFTPNDANAFNSVPLSWTVVGIGDFNGDNRDDLLWRNGTTGQLSNWLANASGNGGFAPNDGNAFSNAPLNWHIVAVGDYNGDNRDDILWRSDSGQVSNWLANANGLGGFTANDANALTSAPTNWFTQAPDTLTV